MDEMCVLKEYRDAVPPATSADLDPARRRLFAEMSQSTKRRRRSPIRFTRPAMWATSLVAAAGVIAVALVGPGLLDPNSGPGGQKDDSAGTALVVNPEATRVLTLAAVAVRLDDSFVVPRADQFLYRKEGSWEGWLSMDGQHDGLILVGGDREPVGGCRDGRQDGYKGGVKVGQSDCQPDPAYRADLPTNGDTMYEYLRDTNLPDSDGFANRTAKSIYELLRLYISPQVRAALFEATSRFPGISVVPDAVVDGQHGIGIGWQNSGHDHLFLFDPVTYLPIGPQFAVVDAVEQRP